MKGNPLVDFLLQNNWQQLNHMLYKHPVATGVELFFDNSNQIELYEEGIRKGSWYVVSVETLKGILAQHDLLKQP